MATQHDLEDLIVAAVRTGDYERSRELLGELERRRAREQHELHQREMERNAKDWGVTRVDGPVPADSFTGLQPRGNPGTTLVDSWRHAIREANAGSLLRGGQGRTAADVRASSDWLACLLVLVVAVGCIAGTCWCLTNFFR